MIMAMISIVMQSILDCGWDHCKYHQDNGGPSCSTYYENDHYEYYGYDYVCYECFVVRVRLRVLLYASSCVGASSYPSPPGGRPATASRPRARPTAPQRPRLVPRPLPRQVLGVRLGAGICARARM